MFSLTLENKNGDQLTFDQNSPFTVSDIQGLNPPDATINTSAVALLDGEKYNSAKVNMRTIIIAFVIEVNASYNRINVYKVLKSKQWIRLYYDGDYRNVYIDGYIQSIDIDYFEKKQVVTCTILCPEPYFKDAQEIIDELSVIVSAFHFPFYGTGGTGLNLLENKLETTTLNGVTMTVNSDGTVVANGSATANTYFCLSGGFGSGKVVLPDWLQIHGTYTISGNRVKVFFYASDKSTIVSYTEETFTVPENAVYYGVFIHAANNMTFANETIYPMIQAGSVSSPTFEAYTEIAKNIVFSYLDVYINVAITNEGDTETGLIFTLIANDSVISPKIFDVLTGEFIGINYEFSAGDQVTIDTRRGYKTITLLKNGVESNLFNALMKNSTWLQLPANGGVYAYEVYSGDAANLIVQIQHYTMYEGV